MIDQTRGPEEKAHTPRPPQRAESKYVYHWDRIIGAFAVLGLLISLVGFGIYTWLKPSPPPASAGLEAVEEAVDVAAGDARRYESESQKPSLSVPEHRRAASDRQAGLEVPENEVKSHTAIVDPFQSAALPEPRQPAGNDVATDPPRQAVAETSPAELKDGGPVQTSVDDVAPVLNQAPVHNDVAEVSTASMSEGEASEEQSRNISVDLPAEAGPEPSALAALETPVEVVSETPSEPESGGDGSVADDSDDEREEGHLRSGATSIVSPAVKRFVLAQSVANNEPKGSLGDIIPNARGHAEVCSFSEVVGLKGEAIEYRWLHEGEQVLKIPVPVGAERWRSHSTKRIYRKMKGAWRVELRDSAGNLLAGIDFVY